MKLSVNLLFYHLTPRTSLKVWEDNGIIKRELNFIFSLTQKLNITHCIIVTHGNVIDDSIILGGFLKLNSRNSIFAILSKKDSRVINSQLKDSVDSKKTKILHYAHQAYSILSIPIFGALFNKDIEVYLRFGWSPFLLFNSTEKLNFIKILTLFFFEGYSTLLSSKIIVTTKEIKKSLIRRFFWCKNKIFIIPNFVSEEFFLSYDSISKKENTILYVGRLSKEKNLENLIEACNILNINLDIIGKGPLKEDLLKISKNNIKFLGTIDNILLPNKIAEYKFLVLPSYSEGAPKVVYEAMALGCIPLLTPFPEAIYLKKKNLCLVSNGFSKNDLIILIRQANFLNKDKYLDYFSRCKKHAKLNYSIKNSLNLHCNLFTNEKK